MRVMIGLGVDLWNCIFVYSHRGVHSISFSPDGVVKWKPTKAMNGWKMDEVRRTGGSIAELPSLT